MIERKLTKPDVAGDTRDNKGKHIGEFTFVRKVTQSVPIYDGGTNPLTLGQALDRALVEATRKDPMHPISEFHMELEEGAAFMVKNMILDGQYD